MVEFGQLAAVAGVLTLLGLTLGFLRRRGLAGLTIARNKPGRRLGGLEGLPLGAHNKLHLVRMGETALLVASSPGGCSLVQSVPPETLERRSWAVR